MHEYSIVQSLVDSVEAAVGSRPNATVRRIHVAIGEVAGVDATLLGTAYTVFRAGTLCERAELLVNHVPARWQCPRCSAEIIRGEALRCGACDEAARLAGGDEIILERIELEVP